MWHSKGRGKTTPLPPKKKLLICGGREVSRHGNILFFPSRVMSKVSELFSSFSQSFFLFQQTVGKAPTRAYHSCTFFHGELWVFGGVYPNPDPQPDGCSDDMFVLNLETNNWYIPIVGSTSKPCPRSGLVLVLLA